MKYKPRFIYALAIKATLIMVSLQKGIPSLADERGLICYSNNLSKSILIK